MTSEENYYPYVTLSGAEYGKERFKNNKTLCHSERSVAEESSRRRIYYFFTLRWIPRQARNDVKGLVIAPTANNKQKI